MHRTGTTTQPPTPGFDMSDKYLIKSLEDAKAEVDKLDKADHPLASALSVLLYAGAESAKERHKLVEQSKSSVARLSSIEDDLKELKEGRVAAMEDKYEKLLGKVADLERKEDNRSLTLKVVVAILAFYAASITAAITGTHWFLKNVQLTTQDEPRSTQHSGRTHESVPSRTDGGLRPPAPTVGTR